MSRDNKIDSQNPSGKCPVNQQEGLEKADNIKCSTSSSNFWSMLSSFGSIAEKKSAPSDGCPVAGQTMTTASLEEAARYAQTAQPGQTIALDTSRQVSSIPRVITSPEVQKSDRREIEDTNQDSKDSTSIPHHQHDHGAVNWIYPSEQQLYNAMRRKGWQNVPIDSIPVVLQIHNNINERTWRQVKEWEGNEDIILSRFVGRPRDLSPKAFLMSYVFRLYDLPFDRHDWYVRNKNSPNPAREQRYVIDYYYLPPPHPDLPPIPYIDARPALDQPRAFYLRTKRFFEDALPGITKYLKDHQNNRNAKEAPSSKHTDQERNER